MKIPGGQKIKLINPKTAKQKGIMVATPTHDGMPKKKTFRCTRDMMSFMVSSGYNMMYSDDLEGANLSSNRINGVINARDAGCHWILFIDSDMTFEPDAALRLVEHGKDIVGGLCVKGSKPWVPTIYKKNKEEGGYNFLWDYNLGDLVECDATGAAFLLIKMEVFDKMEMPYFAFPPQEKRDRPIGEDMFFCQKATELGYKIHVDTRAVIGHLREHAYTIYDFLALAEATREEAEDKSGTAQAGS